MPEILRTFKEKYPGIDIELSSCEGPEEGIRLIRDGDADCGFLATDRAEEIEILRIKDEEDVAVVSLDHPMAERDVFPISEMPDHPFIGYSEGEAPFFGTDTLDTQTLYSIRLYCYGTVGMTREWLLTDNITPSETIVEMMFNSIPDNLRKIFFANQKAGE